MFFYTEWRHFTFSLTAPDISNRGWWTLQNLPVIFTWISECIHFCCVCISPFTHTFYEQSWCCA